MTSMTDQARINALYTAIYSSSTTFTITPGTGGGSAIVITPPYFLRLMGTQGSNTSNGTELTGASGYTAGGTSLGSSFLTVFSGGTASNVNATSWSATGTWSAVASIEVWDSAGTKLRWLQGALAASITGVVNGDTVQFAASSINVNASAA
jgi:hypothetical protein